MRYLISFNESFRGESIKKDLEEIFYSEVEDSGFKIYDCLQRNSVALKGEMVFSVQKEVEYGVGVGNAPFTLVKPFQLGELEEFIKRLFLWVDMSPCDMGLSYMDKVGFGDIKRGDVVGFSGKTVEKLIIRLRVFD